MKPHIIQYIILEGRNNMIHQLQLLYIIFITFSIFKSFIFFKCADVYFQNEQSCGKAYY